MRLLISLTALALISSVSCTRDPERSGHGDTETASRTGEVQNSGSVMDGPATDNLQGDEAIAEREPAAAGGQSQNQQNTGSQDQANPALPRDEKGIVGSPYASNINRATGDQPSVGSSETGSASSVDSTIIDVTQYDFAKKDEFKKAMGARLDSYDKAIESMKNQQTNMPTAQSQKATGGLPNEAKQKIQDAERQQAKLESRLNEIPKLKKQNWDAFKENFRKDVVKLEQTYQEASTASRSIK